jgi:hypothetical protein
MEKSFNLRRHIKKAFNEGVKGYWDSQSRAWMNCYKCHSDQGKGPQEAWNRCLEEFQDTEKKGDWSLNYIASDDDAPKPYLDAKTPSVSENK